MNTIRLWSARIDSIIASLGSTYSAAYVLSAAPFGGQDAIGSGDGIDDEIANAMAEGDEAEEDADDEETIEKKAKKRKRTKEAFSITKGPRVIAHDHGHVPFAHVGALVNLWLESRAGVGGDSVGDDSAAATSSSTTSANNNNNSITHYDIRGCARYRPARATLGREALACALCSSGVLVRARATRLAAQAAGQRPAPPDVRLAETQTSVVNALLRRFKSTPLASLELAEMLSGLELVSVETNTFQRAFECLYAVRDVLVGERLVAAFEALLPVAGNSMDALTRQCSLRRLEALAKRHLPYKTPAIIASLFLDALAEEAVDDATASTLQCTLQVESPVESAGFVRAPFTPALLDKLDAPTRAQADLLQLAVEVHDRATAKQRFGNVVFSHADNDAAVEWLLAQDFWRLYEPDPVPRFGAMIAEMRSNQTEDTQLQQQQDATGTRYFVTAACETRATVLRALLRHAFRNLSVVSVVGGVAAVDVRDMSTLLYEVITGGRSNLVVMLGANDAVLDLAEPVLLAAERETRTRVARVSVSEVLAREHVPRTTLAFASAVVVLDAHLLTEADLLAVLETLLALRTVTLPALQLVLLGDRGLFNAYGRAGGSAFADVAASGIAMCDELVPCTTTRAWHPLASAAHAVRTHADGAARFARLLVASRVSKARDIVPLWYDTPLSQWVVLGNDQHALAAALNTVAKAIVQRLAKGLSSETLVAELRAQVQMLTRLSNAPGILRSTVLMAAPYVVFRGATWRVAHFYRALRQEARTSAMKPGVHYVEIKRSATLTDISLDMPGLLLEFEPQQTATTSSDAALLDVFGVRYNHCVCCLTNSPGVLDVARHRNELRAASFVLSRDAWRGVSRAANRVCMILPTSDTCKGTAALEHTYWPNIAGPLATLDHSASVCLVARDDVGDDTTLVNVLAHHVEQRMSKPRTMLTKTLTRQ